MLRFLVAIGAAACLCLAGAAPALATVTSSTVAVTSPAGSPYLVDNQVVSNGEAITVGGTTNGTASDHVDIKCFSGAGSETLFSSVPINSQGAFSETGSFRAISRESCVLRAVPSGNTTDYPPGSASPYNGPFLNIGQATETRVPSGPNVNDLEYYYLYVSQPAGAFEYASLGGCSISESYSYDPVTFGGIQDGTSESLDYCNAWFSWKNGYTSTPGLASPTRSELQVDGIDAYVAGNAMSLNGLNTYNNSGYPSLTYSYSIDPNTGNLELSETDQVVRCSPGGVYPPSSASCSSFVPTGVQVTMHIVQDLSGRVATVIQSFQSTDGAPHSVDLLENNDFYTRNEDGELDFPWTGSGMQAYTTVGQVLPGPSTPGSGAFFVKGSASVPDGSENAPQGEVTFSNAPSSETIVGTTNNAQHFSWVDLHYAFTIPGGGSVPLGFTYSNAYTFGQVVSDAGAAQAAYVPTISLSAPPSGFNTARSTVTVTGTAADANGLSSVTVNGRPVAVADGAWSAAVALTPGTNTIAAVATNMFGNTARAQIAVIYTPPPSVAGLQQAHRQWRESGRLRKHERKAPVGTTFAYTLNESAQVRFVYTEREPGRWVNHVCVAPNRRNRHRLGCKRTVTLGTHTVSARAGRDRLSFGGAMPNGHKLAPGTYTVMVTAMTPSTGVQSTPRQLTFTIVK